MKSLSAPFKYILILDSIILIICAAGIYQDALKQGLPLKFENSHSKLLLKENNYLISEISPGDTLAAINGLKFSSPEEVEVYMDGIRKNQSIKISFIKNKLVKNIFIKPVGFYSAFYLISNSFAGLVFILIGFFVLTKNPGSLTHRLFHWVVVCTAVIMTTTWGNYSSLTLGLGYAVRFIFSMAYTLTPVIFLHFTLTFPRQKKLQDKKLLIPLYSFSVLLGLYSFVTFMKAASLNSSQAIYRYVIAFDFCRILSVVCIISGLIIFIHSYMTSVIESERKKLRWILFGLVIGPLTFAVLWVIPQALTGYGLIPEELIVILMLSVPVAFSIAILRYHAFDIDLIIRRSVIYSLVIGVLVIIYTSLIFGVTHLIKQISQFDIGTVSAIIIAFLFQPIKSKIQRIVDRKFFRVQYDFRLALKKFLNEIKNSESKEILADHIVEESNKLIPVLKIGFFLFDGKTSRIRLIANKNFDLLVGRSLALDQSRLKTELNKPVALPEKVESTVDLELADRTVFRRWGIALILPIKSSEGKILGFLVLGEKKSGQKYSVEDVDLLAEVILQTGMALEKINIRELLLRERIEKEKLEELNRTKSFFISSVSHELKTPLTSIKMFSELLQIKKMPDDKDSGEYLEIISGECDRLGRLIENVLDLSKIERGIKEYRFSEININSLIGRTLNLMSYQFKIENCTVETELCKDECSICGDGDAVMSAVMNILSNGIKYSVPPKKIMISVKKDNEYLLVCFKNNGPALSRDEIKFITEPYYRSKSVKNKNIPGSGIGLALVKEIMNAHKGELIVSGNGEKGCTFILKFPTERKNETNIFN